MEIPAEHRLKQDRGQGPQGRQEKHAQNHHRPEMAPEYDIQHTGQRPGGQHPHLQNEVPGGRMVCRVVVVLDIVVQLGKIFQPIAAEAQGRQGKQDQECRPELPFL